MKNQHLFFILWIFIQYPKKSSLHIIPPPWSNLTLNFCARKSWQLLHWPEDDKCYNIFTQGPCGTSQELFFDKINNRAACRCPKNQLWYDATKRCYLEFTRGPCDYRQYFGLKSSELANQDNNFKLGICYNYETCGPGKLFWPPTRECYPHLSKGPCLDGLLLHHHGKTGSTKCGCEDRIMKTNYWTYDDTCYELYTKGPCIEGHIYVFNINTLSTECACGPHLKTNYHEATNKCFETGQRGPCKHGQIFKYDNLLEESTCHCKNKFLKWKVSGKCFQAYTQGPCKQEEYIAPDEENESICIKNKCFMGQLIDPATEKCHYIGKTGPCSKGKLWIFENSLSARGICYCDEKLIGYWEPENVCYELGARGPCPANQILSYYRKSGETRCQCDILKGFVPYRKNECVQINNFRYPHRFKNYRKSNRRFRQSRRLKLENNSNFNSTKYKKDKLGTITSNFSQNSIESILKNHNLNENPSNNEKSENLHLENTVKSNAQSQNFSENSTKKNINVKFQNFILQDILKTIEKSNENHAKLSV